MKLHQLTFSESRNSTVTGDTKQTEPTHMDSQPQALENSTDISEASEY